MGRGIDMKVFDYDLGFSVWARDEDDARVKLKELLMSISKDDILATMRLVVKKGEEDDA